MTPLEGPSEVYDLHEATPFLDQKRHVLQWAGATFTAMGLGAAALYAILAAIHPHPGKLDILIAAESGFLAWAAAGYFAYRLPGSLPLKVRVGQASAVFDLSDRSEIAIEWTGGHDTVVLRQQRVPHGQGEPSTVTYRAIAPGSANLNMTPDAYLAIIRSAQAADGAIDPEESLPPEAWAFRDRAVRGVTVRRVRRTRSDWPPP